MSLIDITPHQLLGRLEAVVDMLNARALVVSPPDERLLGYVDRFRELLRDLDEAIQRQRLKDQLNFSLAMLDNEIHVEKLKLEENR